jgi:predicted nucleotidyltransferase
MNTERLFNIVILELSTEKLKIEDRLEQILASDKDIDIKAKKIQKLVSKLNEVENSINRFNEMISTNNNNQNKN